MQIKPGDIIEYSPFGGGTRRVRVTAVHADVKNGRPGFDGELVTPLDEHTSVWGYVSQVTRILVG